MQTNKLYEILQCPDCSGKIDDRLHCTLCKRNFEAKGDIFLLLPLHDLPILSIYDDVNYRKYHAILAQAHDYFYDNPNPIIRWVQHSFYQSIIKHLQNIALTCGSTIHKTHIWSNLEPSLFHHTSL